MACGTPVVGTNAGGMREVVDRPRSAGCSTATIRGAGRGRCSRRSSWPAATGTADACRARAEDFSSERFVEKYEALYRELLA